MRFWQEKSFSEMTRDEWESLCDGCARCCLVKLQDGGEVRYTSIVCKFLDAKTEVVSLNAIGGVEKVLYK